MASAAGARRWCCGAAGRRLARVQWGQGRKGRRYESLCPWVAAQRRLFGLALVQLLQRSSHDCSCARGHISTHVPSCALFMRLAFCYPVRVKAFPPAHIPGARFPHAQPALTLVLPQAMQIVQTVSLCMSLLSPLDPSAGPEVLEPMRPISSPAHLPAPGIYASSQALLARTHTCPAVRVLQPRAEPPTENACPVACMCMQRPHMRPLRLLLAPAALAGVCIATHAFGASVRTSARIHSRV